MNHLVLNQQQIIIPFYVFLKLLSSEQGLEEDMNSKSQEPNRRPMCYYIILLLHLEVFVLWSSPAETDNGLIL